jgi:hypothetical protein
LSVAGIEPALERIANGLGLLQGEVDHIRPIAIGIVDLGSICFLTIVARIPSLIGDRSDAWSPLIKTW